MTVRISGKFVFFAFSMVSTAFAIACGSTAKEKAASSSDKVIWSDAADAWVMEPTACPEGWEYDYVTNSCHHAANNGVDAGNDGIYSCTGATSGPYGHTINWDVPTPGTVCVAEPQQPGSTACCWSDPNASGDAGTPDFSGEDAQDCIEQLCGDQYDPDAGTALDSGTTWPTGYLDCESQTGCLSCCQACCDHNADDIPDYWGDAAVDDREEYRQQCYASCQSSFDSGTTPPPPSPSASTSSSSYPPPPSPSSSSR